MPNLVAYDLAGVQPMNGPTGLIFNNEIPLHEIKTGSETFFDEVDTAFSGQDKNRDITSGMTDVNAGIGTTSQTGSNPGVLNPVGSATSTAL